MKLLPLHEFDVCLTSTPAHASWIVNKGDRSYGVGHGNGLGMGHGGGCGSNSGSGNHDQGHGAGLSPGAGTFLQGSFGVPAEDVHPELICHPKHHPMYRITPHDMIPAP